MPTILRQILAQYSSTVSHVDLDYGETHTLPADVAFFVVKTNGRMGDTVTCQGREHAIGQEFEAVSGDVITATDGFVRLEINAYTSDGLQDNTGFPAPIAEGGEDTVARATAIAALTAASEAQTDANAAQATADTAITNAATAQAAAEAAADDVAEALSVANIASIAAGEAQSTADGAAAAAIAAQSTADSALALATTATNDAQFAASAAADAQSAANQAIDDADAAFTLANNTENALLQIGQPEEFTSRALTNADRGKNLICATAQVATVPVGLAFGFTCSFKGTVTFDGDSAPNDVRTTGAANPWCTLMSIASDQYDAVGTKA